MTSYAARPVRDLLDAFAAAQPLPGGGSAAALTAALGTSLLLMVAGMAKTRTGDAADRASLDDASAALRPARERLIALVDEDSRAYQGLIDAYREPKQSDADRAARTASIQQALHEAVAVPLETMRLCEAALRAAETVIRLGNPNAVTDAETGRRLLHAALDSAGLNVDVNLAGVTDAAFAGAAADERRRLQARAAGTDDAARR